MCCCPQRQVDSVFSMPSLGRKRHAHICYSAQHEETLFSFILLGAKFCVKAKLSFTRTLTNILPISELKHLFVARLSFLVMVHAAAQPRQPESLAVLTLTVPQPRPPVARLPTPAWRISARCYWQAYLASLSNREIAPTTPAIGRSMPDR